MRKLIGASIPILLLSGIAGNAWAEGQYAVTDLGTLGGPTSCAQSINDSGQIVGYAVTAGGKTHAFLYSGSIMHDLGTLAGTGYSAAYGINTVGQIAGNSWTTSLGNMHAFLYSGGIMKDLGTLRYYTYSYGTAINDSGQVVGYGQNSNGTRHAFLYDGLTMKDIGDLGGGSSYAYGINNSGAIVGCSNKLYGEFHPFLYSGGVMQDLTARGTTGQAIGINGNTQVVGGETTANNSCPFLYSAGVTQLLSGTTMNAFDINDLGQVVGGAWYGDVGIAFLYSGGTTVSLNSLLPPNSGWSLKGANAINNNGWIVGWGVNPAGQTHAFLLTPVPEPSTLALLGIGALGLLAYGWRGNRSENC